VSSCCGQRDASGAFINHWSAAETWTPGAANPALSPIVENVNVDGPGVEAQMNLFATLSENGAAATVIAACYTPGGNLYVGTGSNTTGAVGAMRTAPVYNRYFEIALARHDSGNNTQGLTRRVIVAGGAAPRLPSQ